LIGFLFIVAACAFWALDTLIRYPLLQSGVSAVSIVFYEHALLTLFFSIFFFKSVKKIFKSNFSKLKYFIIVGGIGSALSTLAFTFSFNYLNPSLVIILQKFQPVVAISLAHFVLKEKIKREFIFWAFICLLGTLIIGYEDILNITHTNEDILQLLFNSKSTKGYLLVAFSVIGWGASTVFGKKLVQVGFQDEEIMAGRFITGFIFLLPVLAFNQTILIQSVDFFSKISLLVFVSGLLAMYLYYHGLRKVSARSCSLAELFFPFMAVIVNWLFLGAVLSPIQIIGGGLLLVGSLVIQLKHY